MNDAELGIRAVVYSEQRCKFMHLVVEIVQSISREFEMVCFVETLIYIFRDKRHDEFVRRPMVVKNKVEMMMKFWY